MLRPGDTTPVLSWLFVGIAVVLWVAGLFTTIATQFLAALPSVPWEVWRYATAPFVSGAGVLGFVLNAVFFLLIAPTSERELGRRKFLIVFFTAAIAGNALAVITGFAGFGLYGALYGLFGSTLITVWSNAAARTRLLITIAAYVLITLILSPSLLSEIIGGILGGTGAAYVLHRFEDTPRLTRRAYLIIAGGLAALIAIAIVRGLVSL